MRFSQSINFDDLGIFKQQLLHWASAFEVAVCLDSNLYAADKYSQYEYLVAVANCATPFDEQPNIFTNLQQLHQQTNDWLFGMISYDAKNQTETNLQSTNFDGVQMPLAYFFRPDVVVAIAKNQQATIHWLDEKLTAQHIKQQIIQTPIVTVPAPNIVLQNRLSKQQYINKVAQMQAHIRRGNIYEANFCQEFYAQNVQINPTSVFEQLNKQTQAPFAAFVKYHKQYVLCASPERFLQKTNQLLVSQPIKGTIKRHRDTQKDETLKQQLYHNAKERAENVMIVDLVRNDLSQVAQRASVQVNELFGVYTFKTVHHLISTISASLRPDAHFTDALRATFPMGSMTGSPKLRAMQIIEQLEVTRRGMYSGTVGYITPDGNFDFNVVIRTLLYNQQNQYLSLQTGSAITHYATPQHEYDECLLKAQTIKKILLDNND